MEIDYDKVVTSIITIIFFFFLIKALFSSEE